MIGQNGFVIRSFQGVYHIIEDINGHALLKGELKINQIYKK